MRVFLARALVFLLLTSSAVCAADGGRGDLVVVASSSAAIKGISEQDLRSLFVGLIPRATPRGTRAVFNDSEERVSARFLRDFMFMTPSHYERLLAGRRYRDGLPPLARAKSEVEMVRRLQADPRLLSFMPRSRLAAVEGVKVVPVR